jgi:Chlamydia polymorphic membrane protein (Chlamydia_PMP) repeat
MMNGDRIPIDWSTYAQKVDSCGSAFVLIIALVVAVCSQPVLAATCFVAPDAAAGGEGTSWANAIQLQTALATPHCTEIWVAGGVYKPTTTLDRLISFVIPSGVAVYGGFAGVESVRDQRMPGAHPSILSGDIDDNDTGTDGVDFSTADIVGANSYNVVFIDGHTIPVLPNTVVDGFTITGGQAVGDVHAGGGMSCFGAIAITIPAQCSPTLSNLIFSGNLAQAAGGALMLEGGYGGNASPILIDVTFRNNAVMASVQGCGGALFNDDGNSGKACAKLTNVTFSGNAAMSAMSEGEGGAICNEGSGARCNLELHNVTFSGNSADFGGAIFNNSLWALRPTIVSTILWGDLASHGPEIWETWETGLPASSIISDSVVAGGCPAYSTCGAVYMEDPQLGPLQNNGGFTPTIAIGLHGSAIDHGSNCPATDQRGVARPQGAACDIGAYEYTDDVFASGFDGS